MNRFLCSLAVTVALCAILTSFEGVQSQKIGKGNKATTTVSPERTPNIVPFLDDSFTSGLHQHDFPVDKAIQQNSSLPFSLRFPAPPRKSSKFHYPMLPSVYWSLHKKPEVPLVDPLENELGYGLDYQ